jgi:DNA-binding transcriptional MocR family regulator
MDLHEASMPAAPAWLSAVRAGRGPIYLAIANALAGAVGRGEVQPGERLPPHRALAAALGVDLTTVTRAYAEARRRGLLDAAVGRGTFVRTDVALPDAGAPPTIVDMSMNLPPQPSDPPLRDLLRDGIGRLLRHEDTATLMAYRTGAGTLQDRAAGAAWLRPVLGPISPGRVLVCPGAQSAMHAILATLSRPGDALVTESLAYPGLRALAAHMGLTLLGAPMDAEGLLPDALDAICRDRAPRAIVCTPTHQNPTTATMGAARREAVAAVARRHNIVLIEDDAYGLLPADQPRALSAYAPERSFYVATTAKTLSPGLRTAFLVAPPGAHANQIMTALRAATMMASPLLTGLVCLWIRDGTALSILGAIRAEAIARQRLAASILPAAFAARPDSLHCWLELPSHWRQAEFVAYVRTRGVALVASDSFSISGLPPNAVRVALGVAPDQDRLTEALIDVRDALQAPMPAQFDDVI